jgi:hypothetical protein
MNVLIALNWQDKGKVLLPSTVHSLAYANSDKIDHRTGKYIQKPLCILDCTKNMGGVDHVNMHMSFSKCVRNSVKWYKKLFSPTFWTWQNINKPRTLFRLIYLIFGLKLSEKFLESMDHKDRLPLEDHRLRSFLAV